MTATTPLTCDGFANALADYLERDDSPRIRGAVETHAASCADCGALLADLQQLRVDASGLPTLTPSRDLWAGVAERIATPVIEIGRRAEGGGRRARIVSWMRPAAAAAALVVLTAGVTYFATREALLPETQVATRVADSAALDPQRAVADAVDSANRAEGVGTRIVANEPDGRSNARAPRTSDPAPAVGTPAVLTSNQTPVAATLETVYGREIARLRLIIDQRRALLDTATVSVVERNLTIIDQAIRESRAALARDPASAFLNEQLNNALEQKVELMRAAALLPVRS
jgi:hypothetical protein